MEGLEWKPGQVTSRGPWWIDYNHAPPGAGYMHMVFCMATKGPQGEAYMDVSGVNRFIGQGCPTDLTNAKLTARVSGELTEQGAKLMMLIQGSVEGITSGWLTTGQPISVTDSSTEQTINLEPDLAKWTPLGVRQGREDMYGEKPLERVLANVDVNIMLVLFPLDVAPMGSIDGDPHTLRPERDYPVWRHRLPEGYVNLEEVKMDFA